MTAPVSFEYFPPKTEEQRARFWATHAKLCDFAPEYCSVTFGAGGSTLSSTRATVAELHRRGGVEVAPHLSCQGGTREEIRALLEEYREMGIRRLVALRGDMPSGMASAGELCHADELVAFIRAETGDHFHVEVACYPEFHPESEDPASDLKFFAQKVRAGADGAITQYFFNAEAYFRFVEEARAAGVDVPIVPGIMPITNYKQLARFSDLCGAEIPLYIRRRLQACADDKQAIFDIGVDLISRLCERLLEGGAPSLHIYTLNRAKATTAVLRELGYSPLKVAREESRA